MEAALEISTALDKLTSLSVLLRKALLISRLVSPECASRISTRLNPVVKGLLVFYWG